VKLPVRITQLALAAAILAVPGAAFAATPTSTSLQTDQSPQTFGHTVTFTATVAPAASGVVTFFDNQSPIGTATLDGNSNAVFTTRLLTPMNHFITARYQGGGGFAVSTSSAIPQIITTKGANTFTQPTGSPISTNKPFKLAIADFNEDGVPDLAVPNSAATSVTIYLGNGDGTFTSSGTLNTSAAPNSVAVGDFDNSGHTGVAIACSNGLINIYVNDGTANFTAKASIADLNTGLSPSALQVIVADFNGDGIPDVGAIGTAQNIVLGTQVTAGYFNTFLGNGSGGFSAGATLNLGLVTNPWMASVGDFHGHGYADVVIPLRGPSTIALLTNDGAGNFTQTSISPSPALNAPDAITVADFDNDNNLDIAVVNSGSSTASVAVYLGNGAGGFSTGHAYAAGSGASDVLAADINGDGYPDLTVASFTTGNVTILLNDAAHPGTNFTSSGISFPSVDKCAFLVMGDFSGDGRPDMALSNDINPTGSISIGLGVGPSITSLSPNQITVGTAGSELHIVGSNFVSGSTVKWQFGNSAAVNFTNVQTVNGDLVLSGAQFDAQLGTSGTVSITVVDPTGVTSNSKTLTILPAAPTVTHLSISSEPAGTQQNILITVTGTGFANGDQVTWQPSVCGTPPCAVVKFTASVSNSTTLTFTADHARFDSPDSAISVGVQDSFKQDSSNTLTFQVLVPTISSLNVNSIGVDSGDVPLTITGTGFVSGVSIALFLTPCVGGTSHNLTSTATSTQVLTTIPAALIGANPSASCITVRNDPSAISASVPLPIVSPSVTTLNPASVNAGGNVAVNVQIAGANFVSGSQAFWCNNCNNSPTQLSTTFTDTTKLTATIPSNLLQNVGSPTITVNNAGATYTPGSPAIAPAVTFPISTIVISSISPSVVLAGSPAQTLTINGQGFATNASVLLNGNPVQPTNPPTSTQVTVTLSAALLSAPNTIQVIVVNPSDGSQSPPVNLTVGQLAISGVTPSPVVAGSPSFTMQIQGQFFSSGVKIAWTSGVTSTTLATSFVDASDITAIIPSSLVASAGTAFLTASTLVNGVTVTSAPFQVVISGPSINNGGLNPSVQSVGAATFALDVQGLNFLNGSVVQWSNGTGAATSLPTTFISPTELTAIVPSALVSASGTALVSVLNPGANGAASNGVIFVIGPTPTINTNGGLSPNFITAGQPSISMTVNGTNYDASSVVKWNANGNNQSLTTGFLSSNSLTVTVPANLLSTAGTALVTVVNSGGATSNTAVFTVGAGPVPTLTSFSPANGATAGGPLFQLTVNGTNFNQGAQVVWTNGATVQNLTTIFVNSTQLTALVPATLTATAGSAAISVLNSGGGASGSLVFPISAPPAPGITSFSPATVTASTGDFTLQVNGSNFVNGSVVQWSAGAGTQALSTIFISATQLNALVPASLIASGGIAFVNVINPGPIPGTPVSYTINAQPLISSTSGLNPSSTTAGAPGFQMTVTGTGFISSSVVVWAGTDLPTFQVSPTQLTAQVSGSLVQNAGAFLVSVRNPGNPSAILSNSVTFTVNAPPPPTPPAISANGLNPATVPAAASGGAGVQILVTGTGFVSTSVVQFAGTSVPTTVLSSTQLSAQIPNSSITTAGNYFVGVQNPGPPVLTSNLIAFTVTTPAQPSISGGGLSPSSATAGGPAFTMLVTGANYVNGSVVQWNAGTAGSVFAPLQTIFVSPSQLSAQVPANLIANTSGSPTVRVSNPDGGASNTVPFTINPPASPIISAAGGLSPASVSAGGPSFTLVIAGSNFVPTSQALWTAGAATQQPTTTFLNSTQLSVQIPFGYILSAGSALITVQNPGNVTSNAAVFTINPPTIANPGGLSPASASAGDPAFQLTITGSNFVNGSQLQWTTGSGTVALAAFFLSSTQLTASVPAGFVQSQGTASLSVTNPGGSSSNTVQFTIGAPVAPVISANGLSPNGATAGGPAFTLLVTGSGFASGAQFQWNNNGNLSLFATVVASPTQLTVAVPASAIASSGTVLVSVVNASGATSNLVPFTISSAPQPVIGVTGLSPSSVTAGATQPFQLLVSGANFVNGSKVQWDPGSGPVQLNTAFLSSTQLSATVPISDVASPGSAIVTVLNPGNVLSNGAVFAINSAPPPPTPAIAVPGGLSPSTTQAAGSDFQLLVSGSNFVSGSVVQWNTGSGAQALTTSFLGANQLAAQVPAASIGTAGTAFVSVLNPGNVVSNNVIFTVTPVAPPSISSVGGLAPNTATVGGPAFQLIVTGSGFNATSTVQWDNGGGPQPLPTTFVNATQLTATVSAARISSVGSALVNVTTTGAPASNVILFTIAAGPAPSISASGLSPATAVAGGPSFSLVVNGSNFAATAQVLWNPGSSPQALPTVFLSSSQLAAQVPGSDIAVAGTAFVSVSNPGNVTSNGVIFPISAPAAPPQPAISTMNPTSAPAGSASFPLIVSGANFDNTSVVQWNNGSGTVPLVTTFVNSSQLIATVGAAQVTNAGTILVSVKNGSNVVTNVVSFVVNAPAAPTILTPAGLLPASATAGSAGFQLLITGTNFVSGATVQWSNGSSTQSLQTTVVSSTQISATVPGSDLTGAGTIFISVQNPNNSGTSNIVTFPISAAPQPTIALNNGLTPANVLVGSSAFQLVVTGTNFVQGSQVIWTTGSTSNTLATTFIAATQLSAIVDSSLILSAGPVFVSVQNPGNVSSNSVSFSVTTQPAPTISSTNGLSPSSVIAGSPAFVLTISGTNFANGAAVLWGVGSAQVQIPATVLSATQVSAQITANLVAAAGTTLLAVQNPGGVTSNFANFVVTPAAQPVPPTIANSGGLSPASVTAGAAAFQLTVTGSNFDAISKVNWDPGTGTPQPLSTSFISATQLTAVVPASLVTTAGNAFVSVSNASGANAGTSNTVTFTVNPAPPITLNPSSVQVGAAAFTLVITGSNFPVGSVVLWNGGTGATSLNSTVVDPTHVTAAVTANLLQAPGTVFVSVQLGSSTGAPVTTAVPFTISAAPLPTINAGGLAPASGPANQSFLLIVNGSNFLNGATIQLNGQNITPTTFINSTQLTATVPASAIPTPGSYTVNVVNPNGGGSSNLVAFVAGAPVPALTSTGALTPSSTVAGGPGFALVVNGSGFTSSSVVQWNAGTLQPLQTIFVDTTHLQALVPASLITTAGSALVSVSNGTGAISSAVIFTITATPLPTIASTNGINPSSIVAGSSAFTMTVSGTNFTAGSVVQWSGGPAVTNLTTAFISATQLTAIVPSSLVAAPGTIFLTVQNPGGATSNPIGFVISGAQPPQINTSSGLTQASITAGQPSFTIGVTGSNFIPTSVVQWLAGGVTTPLTTAYVSSTQVTALIPANLVLTAGSAFIEVQNAPGVVSNLVPFTVTGVPAPSISTANGLNPATAATGSGAIQITLTGSNYQPGAIALWNAGTGPQTLVTGFVSASQLTALVPASLMSAPAIALIQVQNPDKQISNSVSFVVTGPAQTAAPTVTGIVPNTAAAGSGALQISVSGANFSQGVNGLGASTVQWNGTAVPTTFVSSAQLTATIAGTLLTTPGNNFVNVANSTSSQSNGAQFTVGAPTIASLNPAAVNAGGAGFSLSVIGTNFVNGSTVTWNGGAVPTTFLSSTQITAQISAQQVANAGTALIVVNNPGGSSSNLQTLTLTALVPTIATLSPASAIAGGSAFQLVVTGTNFQTGSQLIWNGTQLPTILVSATQLYALVDSSLIASAGTASVSVQNPGPATSSSVKFAIGGPSVTSVCLAASGSSQSTSCTNTYAALGNNASGPGIQLTITGQNFIAGSTVLWNGTPVPTVFNSSTQLTGYVAANFLTAPGTASVTVQNPGGAVSAPGAFSVGAFTLAITTTSLPDAVVGKSYGPVILTATGGTTPYSWSVTTGTLPDGLLLDSGSGSIAGIPTAAASGALGITVTDSSQRTSVRRLPLRVVTALSITTTSPLAAALMNSPVSIAFAAAGGTPPYKWSASGNVPAGLALDPSTGLLSGLPASPGNYQFSVTVSDSGSAGGQTTLPKIFSMQIAVPDVTIGGLGATSQPATQPQVNVSVSAPYASDLTGSLTLTFASAVGVDDPNIAFSSGGRTVAFTIPAGSTQATFGGTANLALLTGTVAGTITIKANIKSGGADVTPNPAPQLTTAIAKSAPVITAATLTKVTGGVSVGLVGFSTTREITQATVTFTPAAGSNLTASTQTINLGSTFSAWYQSAGSNAFGSQFTIAIPFGIAGDVNAIGSVTVTLTNSVGTSQPVTATFQ